MRSTPMLTRAAKTWLANDRAAIDAGRRTRADCIRDREESAASGAYHPATAGAYATVAAHLRADEAAAEIAPR